MSLEDLFKSWGEAPGITEQEKMENAETAIHKAIKANNDLAGMDISIIRQGSYRSKTNVKQDSDVDVCVCLNSTFFTQYPAGKRKEDYGNIDGSITFGEFKDLVEIALNKYFGSENITPGDKAFDIHSNSYRVDADVVPAFAYRHYYGDNSNDYIKPTGISFDSKKDGRIINWPEHAYKNNLSKHNETSQRYRKIVRIIKRLRNEMQSNNVESAKDIGSYQIESAIWNVPTEGFNHDTYEDDIRYALAHCFNETMLSGGHSSMLETNKIKLLFGPHKTWTREQAHGFFSAAWDYLGFK